MSEPITHALFPHEWEAKRCSQAYVGSECVDGPAMHAGEIHRWEADGVVTLNNEYVVRRPHAMAALCLYKQSYGFTQQDIAAMEFNTHGTSRKDLLPLLPDGITIDSGAVQAICITVIQKIRALLPP